MGLLSEPKKKKPPSQLKPVEIAQPKAAYVLKAPAVVLLLLKVKIALQYAQKTDPISQMIPVTMLSHATQNQKPPKEAPTVSYFLPLPSLPSLILLHELNLCSINF